MAAAGMALAGRAVGGTNPTREPTPTKMGVVIHSYGLRRFGEPLAFLEHCRGLGASGVQTAFGARDDRACEAIRTFSVTRGLDLEGIISLPGTEADLPRFVAEVKSAKRCGARVFRTVLMNGRRYEVFDSAEGFRQFRKQAETAVDLALPVVEAQETRMAIENHKDLQAPDLVDLIQRRDSPWLGVCLDTGNNLALLEDPRQTVELLAPHALATHVKDMAVVEYPEGFLLAEVPLGQGFLDLPWIISTLRRVRPETRLNLEMITRDPLKIPCLTPDYWATLGDLPGKRLASALTLARSRATAPRPLKISMMAKEEQIKVEEENVRECLRYAVDRLEL